MLLSSSIYYRLSGITTSVLQLFIFLLIRHLVLGYLENLRSDVKNLARDDLIMLKRMLMGKIES